MILFVTAIDRQAQWRNFSCQLDELELALDVVHTIVRQGDTLVNVRLLDGNSGWELPSTVFDGHSFTEAMQHLRDEWEFVLAQPVRPAAPATSEASRRLLDTHRRKIEILRTTLAKMVMLLETTQTSFRPGPQREHLLEHYQAIIDRHRRVLARAEAGEAALLCA